MEWVETTGRTIEEALDAALDELGGDERARTGARPGTRGEGTQESRGPRPSRNRRRRGRGGTGGRSEGRREEQERGATVDEQADISVDEQADQAVEFTR